MSTDLMGQAIGLHFKLTSKLLPFPFSWDERRNQLKCQSFTPRFIPWYFISIVALPCVVSTCVGLLVYEIIHTRKIMNFFQLFVLFGTIVVSTASLICAVNGIRFSEECVSIFNYLFPLRNTTRKGSYL
jgi:hypothetical protein